jgi:type VI secretion system secreted protein Hcp
MKRRGLSCFLTSIAVAAVLVTPGTAMAAVDVFLSMSGIKGESTDVSHPDEIEVLSWSWGQSTGTARTRRGVIPAACIQDLAVMKVIDLASPQLVLNSVAGTVAPEAVLTMRKSGDAPLEFLVLRMTNVTVVSYQISASSERPIESVALHFESMKGEYRRQKADGTGEPPVFFEVGGGKVCK